MNNESIITDSKNKINNQINKIKNDNLFDIKQSLYQELTTQSSRKMKYRDFDDSSFKNSKYINYFKLKNNEDHIMPDKDEKEKYNINKNNREKNNENNFKNINNKNLILRNNNMNITDDLIKSQTQKKSSINNINTETNNIDIDNFNNNEDLIYIITTNKNENHKENEQQNESDNYDKKTAYIALPFCHYHKYNL